MGRKSTRHKRKKTAIAALLASSVYPASLLYPELGSANLGRLACQLLAEVRLLEMY